MNIEVTADEQWRSHEAPNDILDPVLALRLSNSAYGASRLANSSYRGWRIPPSVSKRAPKSVTALRTLS